MESRSSIHLPGVTTYPFREQIQEGEQTWRSTFFLEKKKAHDRIRSRREQSDIFFSQVASNVLNILRTYPATLDILVEAVTTLHWHTHHYATEDNFEPVRTLLASDTHANTLYSTLSRHTLRPTPYAAQDLYSQIQEHIAATPRATKVLDLGTRILTILARITHCCPSAIPTLLDSLRVLTAGRTRHKKEKQDWRFTNQTTHILSINLRGMDSADLIKLGEKGLDGLTKIRPDPPYLPRKPMDEEEGLCSLECCPRIAHHDSL